MTTAFDPVNKLMRHPAHVAAFQTGDWRYPPIGVEISPTNSCNAKCPWCFYVSSEYKQHHSQEELEWSIMSGLIDSMWACGVKSITWTGGGEPSTYSHINDAIRRVADKGPQIKQGMFTNAYVCVDLPVCLDWVRITVTEKFVLTKHVRRYVESGCDVGVNFNVTNQNQREMRRLLEEAIDLGVKYFQVRPALADRYDLQERVTFPEWILKQQDRGIQIETTSYKWKRYLHPHDYDVCHGHRMVPFVWYDGKVSVCAYHKKDPRYAFGDLHDETFEQIWAGPRRQKMIEDGVAVIRECQQCCKLDMINAALANEPAHVEFP